MATFTREELNELTDSQLRCLTRFEYGIDHRALLRSGSKVLIDFLLRKQDDPKAEFPLVEGHHG